MQIVGRLYANCLLASTPFSPQKTGAIKPRLGLTFVLFSLRLRRDFRRFFFGDAKTLSAAEGALGIPIAFSGEDGEADDGKKGRGSDEDEAPIAVA